jgi:hypothetical protein
VEIDQEIEQIAAELQFKSSGNISTHMELDQLDFWHYEI